LYDDGKSKAMSNRRSNGFRQELGGFTPSVAGPARGNQGNAGARCWLQKCGVGFSPPVSGVLGVIGLSGRTRLV